MKTKQGGYSVVEVMITLVVGSTFLFSFYQIYNTTYDFTQKELERAYAINMASRFIDEAKYYAGTENRNFDSDNPPGGQSGQPAVYADIAQVQSGINAPTDTGTYIERSLASNVTAGNLLVATVTWFGSPTFTGCTDTRGNTYATAAQYKYQTSRTGVALCYAISSSSGANTIRANFSGSSSARRIIAAEYSGVSPTSPLDGAGAGSAQSFFANYADGLWLSYINATQPKDLVIGAAKNDAATTSYTPGTGFTQIQSNDFFAIRKIHPTTGYTNATATVPNTNYHMGVVAAFKAALVSSPQEPVVIPYKNQPGARGEYRVIITTSNVNSTLQKYNVEVQYGPDSDRRSVKLSAYIRYDGGIYY